MRHKPEIVLVGARGRVRLVDFGLARLFGPRAARHRDLDRVAGTLGYMAPEQFTMPEAVDHRADIYSTGVVFSEMLAGELPGPDRVPPSSKAASDLRLDPIVLHALERQRERRYQEARLMQSEIMSVARTPESTIRIENGENTDLVLIHDRFRDQALRERHAQGWQRCLDRLSRKVGA
jgi:serine/threonine protein kinase